MQFLTIFNLFYRQPMRMFFIGAHWANFLLEPAGLSTVHPPSATQSDMHSTIYVQYAHCMHNMYTISTLHKMYCIGKPLKNTHCLQGAYIVHQDPYRRILSQVICFSQLTQLMKISSSHCTFIGTFCASTICRTILYAHHSNMCNCSNCSSGFI